MKQNLPFPVSHSSKNFSSALNTARWYWSIGIQYLFTKKLCLIYCEHYYVTLPYSMNSFLEESGLCTFGDKVLHQVEFPYATSLESPRVMKDKARVTSEDHLVFNVVQSTLKLHWMNLKIGSTVTTCTYPRRFLDLCTINLITNHQFLVRSKPKRKPYSSPLIVVDLWAFRRVADFLEDSRFTRVGPADNENPESSKSLSEVFDGHSVGELRKKPVSECFDRCSLQETKAMDTGSQNGTPDNTRQ